MKLKSISERMQITKERIAQEEKKLEALKASYSLYFATLAEKAGLLDVDFDEKEMISSLKEVAARFRKKEKQTANPDAEIKQAS